MNVFNQDTEISMITAAPSTIARCEYTQNCFSRWIQEFILHWCSWDPSICIWMDWIEFLIQEYIIDENNPIVQHEDRYWMKQWTIIRNGPSMCSIHFQILCRCCDKNVFQDPADDDLESVVSLYGNLWDAMFALSTACYYHRLKSILMLNAKNQCCKIHQE